MNALDKITLNLQNKLILIILETERCKIIESIDSESSILWLILQICIEQLPHASTVLDPRVWTESLSSQSLFFTKGTGTKRVPNYLKKQGL